MKIKDVLQLLVAFGIFLLTLLSLMVSLIGLVTK